MAEHVYVLLYQQPWREQIDILAIFRSREAAEAAVEANDEPEQVFIEEHELRDA